MTKTLRKYLSLLWLIVITPVFGLIPLLCLLGVIRGDNPICLLNMAILTDVWRLFFSEETPPMADTYPPLTTIQWAFLIGVVLFIAAVAVYDLRKTYRQQIC